MTTPPILVATDLSDSADEALRQAHRLAVRDGAPLTVCHVIPNLVADDPVLRSTGGETWRSVTAAVERVRQDVESRVVQVTGRSVDDFTLAIEEGTPATMIVERAEETGASLVVIGAGNRRGAGLGHVGGRIIRHAHAPVLVARPPGDGREVLVATDFSDPSLPAVAAAAAIARTTGAPLAILHCIELWPALSALPAGPLEAPVVMPQSQIDDYRRTVDTRLGDALARHGATGERVVTEGPADAAIVQAATTRRCGLVVIGTVGKSGLRRLLLGSVAEHVARRAPCSVLIVRLHRP